MTNYDASKEKGSARYYIHPLGVPGKPLPKTYGRKSAVLHKAAAMNGMTYKEFMRIRRGWHKGADD